MSLQVWFPLIGDMHNQGLAGNISFSATPSFSNDGILGKCLSTNRSYISATISQLSNKTEWSICFWVKVDSSATFTNYAHLFNLKEILNDGSVYWINAEFRSQDRVGAINFHVGKETAVGSNTNTYFPTADHYDAKDKWCHFAFTKDATYLKKYINGSLAASYACNTFESGVSKLSTSFEFCNNNCPAFLNDFRIYDNVLTPEEIKKISRGLVAHYELSEPCPNLISNSIPTSLTSWSVAGTGWANSLVDSDFSPSGKAVRCTYTGDGGNSGGIHHGYAVSVDTIANGEKYTVSAWIRASKACRMSFYNEHMTANTINVGTTWKFFSYTCTVNTSSTYKSNIMYVTAADVTTNMWTECCQIKFEKSDKPTPWIPYVGETAYTKLGMNNGIEYDLSGFGYNLTKFGDATVSYTSDSPRYYTAMSVGTQSNSGYILSASTQGGTPVATLSAWVYETARSGDDRDLVIANGRYITIKSTGVLSTYAYGKSPAGYHDGTTVIPLNTWTHLAVVWDDSYVYGYVNGVQDFKIACTGNFTSQSRTTILGEPNSARTFHGYVSDIRFYSTAFSAADVLALAQKRL